LRHLRIKTSIAGRVMSFRDIGKAAFMDLQDRDGRIQVYLNAEAWATKPTRTSRPGT
jgi:lysyl-tRNA synthetase, class II